MVAFLLVEERILLRFFETILLVIVFTVNGFHFKKTFQFFRFFLAKKAARFGQLFLNNV